jgi:hypothetical protein
MPYLPILMLVVCAAFFHHSPKFENTPSLLWRGKLPLVSAPAFFFVHYG